MIYVVEILMPDRDNENLDHVIEQRGFNIKEEAIEWRSKQQSVIPKRWKIKSYIKGGEKR